MKLTKMAFESNDLKGILILALFAIPMIASTNINCSGRAFHCVNSTHFMICVDLGGGVSTTIDDFVIPCPAATVCHEDNVFECDFPEVTTPPLQVIGVYKQSDTSEVTSETNSVTAPTPSSEIFNVFKENITATTLSIPEGETPVVKLEVLEDIKNPVGVKSDNTREASYKVTSSVINSTNEVVNDKETSNNTIITSTADNNKNLEPAVETSINKPANTSSTDKSKSIDTVTSVIGLINLISTDLPSAVNIKPSSNVLTFLDTLYDNIDNTTEQYITKQVTIHGEQVENVTQKIIIPTEIIFNERSATADKVITTPVVNMYIESDINNTTQFNNTIDNQTNAVENSLGKSNNKSELVPETTTEYLAPIKIINILEPVTVDLSPHTTTDNTFVPFGLVNFIADDTKPNAPSTNDYINTFYGDTVTTTTDQYTTKLEIKLSDKPVTAEVISTTPIVNTIYQNVLKNDVNNDFLTELNSTVKITSTKKVPETKINYFIPEPITIGSQQTTTEQTFVPITTQVNVMYTTEMNDLIKNDSLVEKHTTATQALEIIITTEPPIGPTHNLYQINREMNQTMITEKIYSASTINTTDRAETVFNASSTDIINNPVTEPTLLPPTIMKNPTIELTTAKTLHNGLTAHVIEAKNELHATNTPIIVDVENVKNDTLLYNMTNTMKTIETVKTVFNASSTDIITGKSIEPSTIKYPTIEISTAETLQAGSTAHAIEAKNELLASNGPISVNEANLENVGINTLLSGHTTPVPYNVASDLVTNTTGTDLISQSDIVTNPQVGFTAEIIAHKSSDGSASIDHGTIQNLTTDPETKIPGSLNQSENLGIVSLPENLNVDHLNKSVFDKDVVGTTTSYWKNVENRAITPFPSDVTGNNSLSNSVKSINQDNISVTNVVSTQDVLIKTILPQTPSKIYYVSELASTTPITVQTTPISTIKNNTMNISEPVSSYTPEIVDIYRASTTGYKYDSSTSLPVDVTHKTNIENVTEIPVNTLPPQKSTSQKIGTVKQLNATSATTETVSDLMPFTVTTAGYIVLNTTNPNTISWKDLLNIDIVSSKVDPHADLNKTESVKPINGKSVDNSTSLSSTMKDENITVVSVFDIVNSSVNAMPNAMLQPTISNPSLSNVYNETTESQYSSAYVNATDNVPDYNLEQVGELVNQKHPEGLVSFAQMTVVNSNLSTPRPYTIPITEKVQYVGTEALSPSTLELKHINLNKTAVHYVTEKTNDYISAIKVIPTKLNNLPKVETESSVSSVRSVPLSTAVTPDGFTTVPVHDEVTAIKDSAFIMSTTQTSPKAVTDNIKTISTESPLLTKVIETQTVKYNTESSLLISDLEPVAQMITEPMHTSNVFAETTPLDKMNQDDVLTEITTVDLPQHVMSTLNNNIPKPMASLPIVGVTAAQITTEPTHITKVFAQTTPRLAAAGRTNLNQGVLPGTETTDLPQNVLSTVNKNIPQSKPLLPIVGLTARQMTTEPTYTTNEFAQAAAVKTNQDVLPAIKPTDFPQSMMSTVKNNISQSMESQPIAEVTDSQITTEPTHTTNVFSQTTPLLAVSGNTNQDFPSGIKTTDLLQYETRTVTYNSTQRISDITTETFADSLTVPDSMVETIKVVGDKVSGTYLGDITLSNANYSLKSVKNIIDHESIVIGSSSKKNTQNTPITSATSVDFNRAEILNLTESNLMRSDVNIDSAKEEEDSISSAFKSGTDIENKTLLSDSPIISIIEPKDGIPAGKIKYRLTTVTTNYKEVESGAPENVTQLKTIITKENKIAGIDSSMNANIELIDDKKYQFQVDSKNISDSYNINNTKANITTSHNNLSIQKSAINDELEYLISTNHTVTTEVQSHLHESDKQSNKTSDELILNGTSMLKPNLTCTKLCEGSNVTSAITGTALGFNCSNQTRGKYADKKDCRKFYTCLGNLQPMLGVCPNNTVFSEINKQCTRNLSHCVRNNQFRCLFEGRFSDFFKDNIYYICVKTRMNGFIRYKLQCQNDYHINKDLVKCEKNEEISTQESSVSETNNDESNPQPISEKIVSADDFVCKNEGKFPYVKDCSKYYVCDEIKNVYYICVKNRMNGFIRYKLQCQGGYHLNKDTVECEKNEEISTQSASSVTETNNDESKPNPKLETIISTNDFECENEGKFPNAKDCNKYYVCTKIKNVYRRKIKKCASEEVFDKKKKMCVESDSGEC